MRADRASRKPGPLRALLDHIEASAGALERPTLEEFQELWGRIRNDSQVRQSLAAVPEGAGPLHSSTLLHRAMGLMRDASPGYLEHFIAYADALSWMEQLQDGDCDGSGNPAKTRARKRGT
ncbi:DUF2894 domain-containing protein [Lysobacter sp. GX 14042]|uniref:DUF2894 domain-containing protein n=1 Tax=Lysobacter sp. GX 14042 TaxID=2907155 RepID=UPI001F2B03FC|nr:DUF2894 domain-containing protein [Lysobacter sp. GX 14042]MCE7033242.1 DUF2894 domain-containing protein [Lysobacter sp. GX 14042]